MLQLLAFLLFSAAWWLIPMTDEFMGVNILMALGVITGIAAMIRSIKQ